MRRVVRPLPESERRERGLTAAMMAKAKFIDFHYSVGYRLGLVAATGLDPVEDFSRRTDAKARGFYDGLAGRPLPMPVLPADHGRAPE